MEVWLYTFVFYKQKTHSEKGFLGVPVMAQWVTIQLAPMRIWVPFPASISGLRIWHYGKLRSRSQMGLRSLVAVAGAQAGSRSSNSTPSLGTSICHRGSPKKQKKKKKEGGREGKRKEGKEKGRRERRKERRRKKRDS